MCELLVQIVAIARFVQHDPTVADGVAGLREQAGRSAGGLEIVRVLEDGHFVVAHGWNDAGDEGEVFFAVFRFEHDLLDFRIQGSGRRHDGASFTHDCACRPKGASSMLRPCSW